MAIAKYSAQELFQWLVDQEDILVLDVRNDKDFNRFQVESPYPFSMLNVSYYDFMEVEDESAARIARDKPVKIVCAKEGSAKYVAEILDKHGFEDIGYLEGGIKSWGNLLVPMLLLEEAGYALYQFIRPGKASCSYGLISGGEMMTFDPSRAIDFYTDFAAGKGCRITHTFETHLQADYIAGSRDLAALTGAVFHANEKDFKDSRNDYVPLTDGEIIRFSDNGPEVRVLFTPGHTPGSTCFIIDEKYIISGDMMFINSVGRPDLGGQAEEWAGYLFDSIQLVKELDEGIIVLPAHYMDWKEANEQLQFCLPLKEVFASNSHIYDMKELSGFVDFIKANIRPQPEEYKTIRLINANLEQYEADRLEEFDLGKNECAASAYAQQQAEKS